MTTNCKTCFVIFAVVLVDISTERTMHVSYNPILLSLLLRLASVSTQNGSNSPVPGVTGPGGGDVQFVTDVPVSKCCPDGEMLSLPSYSCIQQSENIKTFSVNVQGLDLAVENNFETVILALLPSGVGKPRCGKWEHHLIKTGK